MRIRPKNTSRKAAPKGVEPQKKPSKRPELPPILKRKRKGPTTSVTVRMAESLKAELDKHVELTGWGLNDMLLEFIEDGLHRDRDGEEESSRAPSGPR